MKAVGINNARQFSRLKFDRINVMLGHNCDNEEQNKKDAAYEFNLEFEYEMRHGPAAYNENGRAARRARRAAEG